MEELLLDSGFNNIAGIDEVGRGSLAGPVVSAAVVLDKKLLIDNPLKFIFSIKNKIPVSQPFSSFMTVKPLHLQLALCKRKLQL